MVLPSLLPARSLPWRRAINPQPHVKARAISQTLKTYAKENAFNFLDYLTGMSDSNGGMLVNLAKEDVHPKLNGYKAMEPLAEQAIKKQLKKAMLGIAYHEVLVFFSHITARVKRLPAIKSNATIEPIAIVLRSYGASTDSGLIYWARHLPAKK